MVKLAKLGAFQPPVILKKIAELLMSLTANRMSMRSLKAMFRFAAPYLRFLPALLVVALFLADVWVPIALAIPMYYVAALLFVVALPRRRDKFLVAVTCTLLAVPDYVLTRAAAGAPDWLRIVNHGLSVIVIWTVAVVALRHTRDVEALRVSERVAYGRLAQLRTTYASAPVGLCFVDRDLRYLAMNNTLAEMHGHPPDFYLGKTVREATPELADAGEEHYRRVINTGRPVLDVEVEGATVARPKEKRHWLASYHPVRDENGTVMGVNVAVRDITERKQAEADTMFLLDVGECIRFAADPDEMMWAIAVGLGEHLGASRCSFAEIDVEHDVLKIQRDYRRHARSLAGSYSLKRFGAAIVDDGKAGRTIVVNDARRDERMTPIDEGFERAGISALIVAPLLRDGRLASCLFVAASEPRSWSEREVALVDAVAERTWLAAERLRLDHALRHSGMALREADRRKDEFLATLAHELRNPLGLIRNVVSLLQSAGATDSEIRWGRDIIDRQVNYLTRLTDDLFDVSRITRDKLDLRKEDVQLAEIINAAVESCRPLMNERGHIFTLNMGPEPVYLSCDKIRLTQAITNLLNNAAKYTQSSGRIGLSVERDGDEICIRVTDTGIGIAAEDLNRVFDLFFQADRSFARAEGGLGLGLTLVNRLVAMHGGTVEVKSAGFNQGSEFIVRLPVIGSPSPTLQDVERNINAKPPAPGLRRVLVADDFPESAQLLARLLQQDGNDVRVALDGLEAVETAAQFHPDIVLLDIAMPKLNGYEAASKIRQEPWGKNIILIALTGWGQQQDRSRTKEAGFDVHLTKPVNYQAIAKLLNDLSGDACGAKPPAARFF
jgi:PAS domain S-box-containing protein